MESIHCITPKFMECLCQRFLGYSFSFDWFISRLKHFARIIRRLLILGSLLVVVLHHLGLSFALGTLSTSSRNAPSHLGRSLQGHQLEVSFSKPSIQKGLLARHLIVDLHGVRSIHGAHIGGPDRKSVV